MCAGEFLGTLFKTGYFHIFGYFSLKIYIMLAENMFKLSAMKFRVATHPDWNLWLILSSFGEGIGMDLRYVSGLISTSSHHWERDGSRPIPEPFDNWICWLSKYSSQALNCFQCLQSGCSFALCIASSSQQWWLYNSVQWILDCLPVSVNTEPVYSDDQFAHSYSNPWKLQISGGG